MLIRDENPDDFERVRTIADEAFGTSAESILIANLRLQASPHIALVAEKSGAIVGHIMFSPVTIGEFDRLVFGLAPMAVSPPQQGQGIGSALIQEGLERCRRLDAAGVVVLGHSDYYPRFGFTRASTYGLTSEYDVPDDVFMALELFPGGLGDISGRVHYHPAFSAL